MGKAEPKTIHETLHSLQGFRVHIVQYFIGVTVYTFMISCCILLTSLYNG
jgi:hypothetical protein